MKKILSSALLSTLYFACTAQPATPDKIYGSLFDAVQMQRVFTDGKTFVDCTPKRDPAAIVADYQKQKPAGEALKAFVQKNFEVPAAPQVANTGSEKDMVAHINALWKVLRRMPDKSVNGSTLLPLPKPYIVPGGRFREVYYWDSFFTMLGLMASGEVQTIQDMVDNFTYLINTYGHIPNGNRSYYLSRSQPPFYALMVDLLASIKGEETYTKYLPAIEKEYMYWMEGDKKVKNGEAYKRVVKMPDGELMNRYWDDNATPRQESYREDRETSEKRATNLMARMRFASKEAADAFRAKTIKETYSHLRAGAASGWDFSSRWFDEPESIETIETTNFVPVDLNCLLYFYEELMSRIYAQAGNKQKSADFLKWSKEREAAINKYCWNGSLGYYCDYRYDLRQTMDRVTAAGMFPFCFFNPKSYTKQIAQATEVLKRELLRPGGVLTTPFTTGQQWDAPNGWAPLQWMTIYGLHRNGRQELAKDIATRWVNLNKAVYARTGKLLEKYNVVDTHLESGGGEYPTQDGFGWTNGVALSLIKKYGL